MRIGLYTSNYPGVNGEGGIGTYTRHLAHGFSEMGQEVHVLTPITESDATKPEIQWDGPVAVHLTNTAHLPGVDRLIPGAGAVVRMNRAAHRLAQKHHLDIFEFANYEGVGAGFVFTRRVPLAVRLSTSSAEAQAIDELPATRRSVWEQRREGIQARKADVLITHSRAHQGAMAEELGINPERIHVVPLCVDIKPPCPESYLPHTGDAQGHEPTVVFVGRMEKRKGTVDLLQAIPPVLQKVPRARFVFIGKDRPHCPGERTHEQFIREELPPEVAARISLLGRLPDDAVDCWMQKASVFVAPSLYESFGLVFLEAMRWGTPVIGTCAGGIPEVVEDGKTGVLVPPSHPQALAEAITGLLLNQERRLSLGAAAKKRVHEYFTVSRLAEQTLAIYEETICKWKGAS